MIGPTSIVFAERVTMQATPQDIPGGIPNGRDTAETPVHPGQMLDKKNPDPHAYPDFARAVANGDIPGFTAIKGDA